MVSAKLAIALALAVPNGRQGPANYWLVDDIPGLEAGALVATSGVVVGRVVAKKERGDTTFLRVRFTSEKNRLPRSRILWIQPVGFEGLVALELASRPARDNDSVERGGRLRVIFETPSMNARAVERDPRTSDEPSPPWLWQPAPRDPPVLLRLPLLST